MGRSTAKKATLPKTEQLTAGGIEDLLSAMAPPPTQAIDAGRIVMLHGEVSEGSISSLIAHMLHLANESSTRPIQLIVSTVGGEVSEMFALWDVINFLPCPVHTVALGKVMSAGVLLLAAGVKGKRMIGASTRVMLHPVSGGALGNVFEVANAASEQRRVHDMMVSALLKETKMTKKKIDEIMNLGHDYYMTATEAVKLGIVDHVIG